ncbi:hypothetical protein C9374_014462 [Naegleria lovaniensis]|uniref:Uncharacterized protein n=1 Tax=Naegleria lovaniensis TaxID=51637 RepID=A0AA88GUD9_NAELO|nr:uncharacterized protein C9374_014462 [Naegleria lovaniensis]KAG2389062.1 hypothetical protein C9374_014462 [Naegleria lovaniensis]
MHSGELLFPPQQFNHLNNFILLIYVLFATTDVAIINVYLEKRYNTPHLSCKMFMYFEMWSMKKATTRNPSQNFKGVEEAFFTIAREIKSRLIDSGEVDPEETKAQDREPGTTEKKDTNTNKTSTGGSNGTVKIDSQGTGEADKKKKKSWCSIL